MTDLKDRVGVITGGNANLIKDPGDIITGDGNQTVYLRNPNVGGASDGFALVLDSSTEEGLNWAPAAGGTGLTDVTGSDGVTVTSPTLVTRNATNDLVTGVDVAQVNMDSLGPVTIDAPAGAGNGIALLATFSGTANENPKLTLGNSGGAGAARATLGGNLALITSVVQSRLFQNDGVDSANVSVTSGAVTAESPKGMALVSGVTLPALADGEIDIEALSDIRLNSDASITLTGGYVDGSGNVNLLSGSVSGDIQINAQANDLLVTTGRDETHTVGRNFALTASGATGININAENGNTIIDAGSTDGTGEVRIMPTAGVPAATRTFRIWDGAGTGQQTVLPPSGGAVQDTECRDKLQELLVALFNWGWLSNPLP